MDYPGGPSIITRVLISDRERQESQRQSMRCEKGWTGFAGFGERREPGVEDAGGKEAYSALEPPEKNSAPAAS